jgi:hypothetical protein
MLQTGPVEPVRNIPERLRFGARARGPAGSKKGLENFCPGVELFSPIVVVSTWTDKFENFGLR